MRKRLTTAGCIMLCAAMIMSLCSCSGTTTQEEAAQQVTAADVDVAGDIPVSETEIIEFYKDLVSAVKDDGAFTSENKPGVKTDASISVRDINVVKPESSSGDTADDGELDVLNKSADAIKDRIISGLDLSVPTVAFGDMSASASDVIYPYGSAGSGLDESDVKSAKCYVDGSALNIEIILNNTSDAVSKVFEQRDKSSVISKINEQSGSYAKVSDYSMVYADDDENNVHSVITLTAEVEKQDDGTYQCTGRIETLKLSIVSDVTADVACKGSFERFGDVCVTFRMYDEKSYEFDWLGTSTWEPTSQTE